LALVSIASVSVLVSVSAPDSSLIEVLADLTALIVSAAGAATHFYAAADGTSDVFTDQKQYQNGSPCAGRT
jgi:hypothetical protein